jgi:hypothetical protein
MLSRAGSAWLQRREQHRPIEPFVTVLALQKRVLRMIAVAQFASASSLHSSIRLPEDNPTDGLAFPSARASATDLRMTSMARSMSVRGSNATFALRIGAGRRRLP